MDNFNSNLISEQNISIVLFLMLFSVISYYKIKSFLKSRKIKRAFKRGSVLEKEAKYFLEKKGYHIIDEQSIHYHNYSVNGEAIQTKLIVDYVVRKNKKTYLVEVKSGKSAISIKDKNTRRQLLEYDTVIENDGVFLLDMEHKKMQLIKFYSKSKQKNTFFISLIIIVAILGILLPFWSSKLIVIAFLFIAWFYYRKTRKF